NAAVLEQMERYAHVMVYGEMIQAPQVKLAAALAKALPENLSSVYFTNSGTEAVEGAVKLARRYTGKPWLVAQRDAYHGSTAGALSLMSNTYYTGPYRPLVPGVRFINQNDLSSLDIIHEDTAAVILEFIQAERGCKVAQKDYIQAVADRCKAVGALLIADEIQTGMCRSGTFFAFEQYGIVPDILITGKAFGAGFPLAAFVSSNAIMAALSDHPVLGHITTFGGHPVCCAAALKGLELMQSGNFHKRAEMLGNLFRSRLEHIHGIEISGCGALLAVKLPSEQHCRNLIAKALELGVITDWFLFAPDAFRIAPPLIMSEKETLEICDILEQALHEVLT
ncbi:MAG: aspartate aminotransferase family protein, partial [Bacteroidetes bacterium]|nr:aspartate aminotransferase family protein [Bacteroidota bacterium]